VPLVEAVVRGMPPGDLVGDALRRSGDPEPNVLPAVAAWPVGDPEVGRDLPHVLVGQANTRSAIEASPPTRPTAIGMP
jgi:hypothetical protein